MIAHVVGSDHGYAREIGPTCPSRSSVSARRSRRNGPRCSSYWQYVGRRPLAGAEVDAALCRATHRLARAGSRLGDGGPLEPGGTSIDPRWLSPGYPVAEAAIAMTASADSPDARSSRTAVSPADFDSFRPSGRRTSGWCANVGGDLRPSTRPSRIGPPSGSAGLGRGSRGRPLGAGRRRRRRTRTSSCRAGLGWAGRRPARRPRGTARRADPSTLRHHRRARTGGSARRGRARGAAWTARPGPRAPVRRGPSRERRTGAVTTVYAARIT